MEINGRTEITRLLVTGLGKQRIILGFPWLNRHNPNIDWKTGKITWRNQRRFVKISRDYKCHLLELAKKLARQATEPKQIFPKTSIESEEDEEERFNWTQNVTMDNDILSMIVEDLEENYEV